MTSDNITYPFISFLSVVEVSTPEAGQIFLIDEAVLPLREAFKEDPVEAHRRASLMVIEHGNKGLYDLAEAIGKESIACE